MKAQTFLGGVVLAALAGGLCAEEYKPGPDSQRQARVPRGTVTQHLYGGNWYLANQEMYSPLEYAGYEVKFVLGTDGHNSKHGPAIQPDGSLEHSAPFCRLETTDPSSISGAQICGRPGRVVGIINKPQPGPLSNVVFGGPGLDMLYVTAGDKVYRRHLRRKEINSWTVVKPPQPRL
ncbi:MAG: hypothetical protein IT165_09735 [Bryobacterales bacterium]|nr:hypothetical protein [Bryobacterales bacterium]